MLTVHSPIFSVRKSVEYAQLAIFLRINLGDGKFTIVDDPSRPQYQVYAYRCLTAEEELFVRTALLQI